MARPTKFIPGPIITDPLDAMRLILDGQYLYEHHKPQSPAWTINWPVREVQRKVNRGWLRIALPNPDHKAKEPENHE
jgi:hypothetical protein